MAGKATYEELEQRVKELEKEYVRYKHVEAELRESNEHYKILFDKSAIAVFRTSIKDGKILSVNDAGVQMLGFSSKQELISEYNAYRAYVNPDDRKKLLNELNSKGQIENFQAEFYRKDGTTFWGAFYAKIYPKEGYLEGTAIDITSKKQVEEALRRSGEKYRMLFDTAPDGVAIVDPNGVIVDCSQSLEQLYGYPKIDIIGKGFTEFMSPSSVPTCMSKFQDLQQGKTIEGEVQIIKSDNTIVEVWRKVIPLTDESGDLNGVLAYDRDITDRKRAEEALRESEEKARIILDASIDSIILIDFECNILEINRATAEKFCKTREELIGKNITDILPSDVANLRKLKAQEAMQSGRILRFEDQREGSWYDQICHPIFDTEGKETILAVIARDITDRKRAEEALRKSESNLKLIYDTVGDVLFQVGIEPDDCYRFLSINHAFLKTTGLARDQIVGKRIEEVIPETSVRLVLDNYKKAIEENRIVRWEETSVYPAGEKLGEVSIAPVLNEKGICTHLVGSVHDVTERKQAEEALRESEEKYHKLFDTVSDAIMVFDAETKEFIDANDAVSAFYGYTREEFLELKHTDITSELEKSDESIRQTIAGKISNIPIRYHKRKDGTTLPVEISTGAFKLGNRQMVYGVARDITKRRQAEEALKNAHGELEIRVKERTAELGKVNEELRQEIQERKRAEEEVRESEEKYRLLVETMSDGIGMLNENGVTVYTNDRFLEMVGYSKDEILGQTAAIFFNETNLRIFQDQMKKRRKGQRHSYEIEFTRKDGQQVPTIMSPQPIIDPEGNFKGSFAVITDISELKSTEKALKAREKELETKTSNLEEVNTALNVLLNKRDDDKTEFEESVLSNVRTLIEPYLAKLQNSNLSQGQETLINILESNLNEIVSQFSHKLTSKYINLTHAEIQVANLVKHGKSTKEIAGLLSLSYKTIEVHRTNIRRKIGIKNKKANLRTFLLSYQ